MRRCRRAAEHGAMAADDSPRIVIAGGGVAGLEACLALRSFLGEDELHIDLLCRERPLRVPPARRARAVRRRAGVEHGARALRRRPGRATRSRRPGRGGAPTGTRPSRRTRVASPTTPCSSASAPAPCARSPGRSRSAAAATPPPSARRSTPCNRVTAARSHSPIPFGAFWTLPLYELAILAAARLRDARGAGAGRHDLARGRAARGLRRRRLGSGGSTSSPLAASSSSTAPARSRPTPASWSSTTAGGSRPVP